MPSLHYPPGANRALHGYYLDSTSPAVWDKPDGAAWVQITCVGAGGAGGSGSCTAPGTIGYGGRGGGGGAFSQLVIPASELPDQCVVGVGDRQRVTNDDGALPVTSGFGLTGGFGDVTSDAYFGTEPGVFLVYARGGYNGTGGGATRDPLWEPTAANAVGGGQFVAGAGGEGGDASTRLGRPNGVTVSGYSSGGAAGGCGGGGGLGTDESVGRGGWGSASSRSGVDNVGSPGLGVGNTSNPGAVVGLPRPFGVPAHGGSGGGSVAVGDAGYGADGQQWGAGGGGGGAARIGFTSGGGGTGGPGIVVVTVYF